MGSIIPRSRNTNQAVACFNFVLVSAKAAIEEMNIPRGTFRRQIIRSFFIYRNNRPWVMAFAKFSQASLSGISNNPRPLIKSDLALIAVRNSVTIGTIQRTARMIRTR